MRRLAVFAGAFSGGIFLAQYLLPGGWVLPAACLCLALGCAAMLLPWEVRRRCVVIGAALALGLGWNWLYARQVQRPMEALADTDAALTMTLQDYAVPTDYGAKATVRLEGLPGKAVYYGGEDLLDLRPGQTVDDLVHLQSAAHVRDTDITAFTSKGVFLLAYQRGEPAYGPGTADSPRWWPVRLGQAMREKIESLFDGDTAAFLAAILTGDKTGLSETAYGDLSEAGMLHILAVSGMHCGFLLALVTMVTGKHRRRLTAACALPVLAFYAALTGGSPSVLRACVMLALLLAAPLFRRDSDGPTTLALALGLILLKNPFAAASVSLQLSFAAMAGILWLTPRLHKLLLGGKKRGKTFRILEASFVATMGALVFTVPLSAYYFGTLVLISPLSNLLCLWAAGVVFMLGLLAVLAGFLWMPLGAALGLVPGLLARYILSVAHLLAKVPCHAVYFDNPYLKFWLAFAYLLFALAYVLRPRAGRKYAVAAALAVCTLALTVRLGAARYDGDLDAVVLDVGQGQSVVLASGGAFALADCGSGNSWCDAGGIAARRLRSMGCRRLDYLILTHYDLDHVSGVTALLSRMDVGALLVPAGEDDSGMRSVLLAAAESHGVPITEVDTEQTIPLGRASLRIFPPVGDSGDNERGLSLCAAAGTTELFITGDMDSATERTLLQTFDLPDIEALVAGHHGSKNSTSAELLDALTPEIACISVGSNSYGHPADETMRRLAERGCAIYRTDMQGSIHLSVKQGDQHGIREENDQDQ